LNDLNEWTERSERQDKAGQWPAKQRFHEVLTANVLGRHAMEEDARVVRLFSSERQRNHIQTNKYTWYNFLPKNLLEQFSQSGNLYFLMVAVGQLIPSISNTQGKPATLLPLSAVVSMQAVKDLFEDSARVQSDKVENNRTVTWLHPAASCCILLHVFKAQTVETTLRIS